MYPNIVFAMLAMLGVFGSQAFISSPRFSHLRWNSRRETRCNWKRQFGHNVLKSVEGSFQEVFHEFQDCTVPEIQKCLVQKGIEFQQEQNEKDENEQLDTKVEGILQSSLDRVLGCVATVFIRTTIRQLPQSMQHPSPRAVQFEGQADAMLSRGLLAVLADALSSASSIDEILAIEPYTVADRLGIRRALSPGRNDGIANMMQVIQQQIRSLVESDNPDANDENCKKKDDEDPVPLYVEERQGMNSEGQEGVIQKSPPANSSTGFQSQRDSSEHRPTVALLLSGGVDSSVALRLLLEQNYDVTGRS
jgi:sulfur transfer protein SufE